VLLLFVPGVAEGRDPLAELAPDDPRELQAKQAIEQVTGGAARILATQLRTARKPGIAWQLFEHQQAGWQVCVLRTVACFLLAKSHTNFCAIGAYEAYLLVAVLQEKGSYKAAFSQLRDLKGEIEHLQLLLEQSRQKLQRDFQQWLGMVARQQQEHQQGQQGQQQQQGMAQQDFQPQADQQQPSGIKLTGQQQQTSSKQDSITSSRPSSARLLDRSSSSSSSGPQRESAAGRLPRSVSQRQTLNSNNSSASVLSALKAAGVDSGAAALASSSIPAGRAGKSLDMSQVDPQVLQAAAPHLTGNAAADEDIIKFYEARAKLLQKLGQQ
jgi:hypothetical protein